MSSLPACAPTAPSCCAASLAAEVAALYAAQGETATSELLIRELERLAATATGAEEENQPLCKAAQAVGKQAGRDSLRLQATLRSALRLWCHTKLGQCAGRLHDPHARAVLPPPPPRAGPPLFVHWPDASSASESGGSGVREGAVTVAVARASVMTLTVLSHDPRIVLVDNFLSAAEAAAVVAVATVPAEDAWLRSSATEAAGQVAEAADSAAQADAHASSAELLPPAHKAADSLAGAAEAAQSPPAAPPTPTTTAPSSALPSAPPTAPPTPAPPPATAPPPPSPQRHVSGRTSSWRHVGQEHEVLAAAVERAAWLSGLSPAHAEACQVVHYRKGEHYREHVDHYTRDNVRDAAALGPSGNRLISTFVYLAAPSDGSGCTRFPLLGLRVMPTPGTALLWHNLDKHGSLDGRTLHCGDPPLAGEKLGMNIWLRQRPHGEGVADAAGGAWRPAPPPPCTAAGPKAREAATLRERN